MAKETITRLVDDLDGGVAHETVTFGLDGHLYEIDLSTKNAKKLRTELGVYVDKGNRVSNRATAGAGRSAARGQRATAGDKDQSRAIREWAQAKGYDVALRGRIKRELIEEFQKNAGR